VTKLWNATRYAILNLSDFDPAQATSREELYEIDSWIISKSESVAAKMKSDLELFEF